MLGFPVPCAYVCISTKTFDQTEFRLLWQFLESESKDGVHYSQQPNCPAWKRAASP